MAYRVVDPAEASTSTSARRRRRRAYPRTNRQPTYCPANSRRQRPTTGRLPRAGARARPPDGLVLHDGAEGDAGDHVGAADRADLWDGAERDRAQCQHAGRRGVHLLVAARHGADRGQPRGDGDLYADRRQQLHDRDRDRDVRGGAGDAGDHLDAADRADLWDGAERDPAQCQHAGCRHVHVLVAARHGADRGQPRGDGELHADRQRQLHHRDRDGDVRGGPGDGHRERPRAGQDLRPDDECNTGESVR